MPPIDHATAQAGASPAARITGFKHDEFMPRLGRTSAEWRKTETASAETTAFWGDDGFTFGDLLDLVNPLQHIPVVASIYRGLTGDKIAPGPRLIGDGLFSLTPLGAAASMAAAVLDIALEAKTGDTLGGHLASAIGIGGDTGEEPTAFAEIDGMPWLEEPTQRQLAETAPRHIVAASEAAVAAPDKPEPAIAPIVVPPVAANAAPTPMESTAMPGDTPEMSPDQWATLLAGLGAESGSTEDPKAPPEIRRPGATETTPVAPTAIAPAPVPRDAVAAAMTDALDKYATLQSMRTGRGKEIDQEL